MVQEGEDYGKRVDRLDREGLVREVQKREREIHSVHRGGWWWRNRKVGVSKMEDRKRHSKLLFVAVVDVVPPTLLDAS